MTIQLAYFQGTFNGSFRSTREMAELGSSSRFTHLCKGNGRNNCVLIAMDST